MASYLLCQTLPSLPHSAPESSFVTLVHVSGLHSTEALRFSRARRVFFIYTVARSVGYVTLHLLAVWLRTSYLTSVCGPSFPFL